MMMNRLIVEAAGQGAQPAHRPEKCVRFSGKPMRKTKPALQPGYQTRRGSFGER
jgi:hypothetical protein